MNFLRSILVWLRIIPTQNFSTKFATSHPSNEDVKKGQIWIVRDGKLMKWSRLRCPCGCGEVILLSLSSSRSPKWKMSLDWLRRPSLSPSIRRIDGCKSHFWIRSGRVDWC
jgi:hypothetical protein